MLKNLACQDFLRMFAARTECPLNRTALYRAVIPGCGEGYEMNPYSTSQSVVYQVSMGNLTKIDS